MGPNEYLQVNVYRGQGFWTLAVRRCAVGRPHRRLTGDARYIPLTDDSAHVSTALRIAAERLADLAEEYDPSEHWA
jgi:hypothetical protein